jgi:hypothetical protein
MNFFTTFYPTFKFMRIRLFIFSLLIFVITMGCFSEQRITDNLTEIDVSKDYPEKEPDFLNLI